MKAFLAPLSAKIFGGLSVALLIALGVLWALYGAEKRHSAKVEKRLTETQATFDATVADYRAKAEQARLADLAHKNRVEKDQANVSLKRTEDYRACLADLDRCYRLLRLTPTHSSGSRKPPVPSVPDASGGADAAPETCNLTNAKANAVQLDALQQWIGEQQAIPRN